MNKKTLFSVLMLVPTLFLAQQKVSIIPSVSYGWRLGEIASELSSSERSHIKKLKNGVNIDIAAYYHLNSNLGIGAKYHHFGSSATSDIQTHIYNYGSIRLNLNTKDRINFIGAGIIYSNFNQDTKHKFYYDMALGLISYKSTSSANGISNTSKGSNLGLAGTLSYMYAFNQRIYVGPQVNYTMGVLKKVKNNGQTLDLGDSKESLYTISIGLGATIRL